MKRICKIIRFLFLIEVVFLSTITSCKKDGANKTEIELGSLPLELKKVNHSWFYFTENNFKQIEKPQLAPHKPQKPWTETIRISSANNSATNSIAIVNRLGVLTFNGEQITLNPDPNLFANRTAGNLLFLNETPIFSVYKSSFFNDTISDAEYKNNKSAHLFLMQYDIATGISYPIIDCSNLTQEKNSEVTDLFWDGLNWACSIKTVSESKNSFNYITFHPTVPLLSLSPSTANGKITVTPSDAETFRNIRSQHDFTNAPERIKLLLNGFHRKLPFSIEVKTEGGSSPRTYGNSVPNSQEKELQAKAIISRSWSAALFEDGTLFIEGALPGKHILRGGKAVAIRLPKLPSGYLYTDFVISGTTLYAAWEESSFYKTSRSGFLQVNIDKTLYGKIL